MKKLITALLCTLALFALAGGVWLYTGLTAKTAPPLPTEPADALPGQILAAVFTGEEVAVTQGQLNGLLQALPPEERQSLLGVELTGENAAALWAAAELFGKTCHVRAQLTFTFAGETGELCCTLGEVQVGRVPLPEFVVERALKEGVSGLDFSGRSIIINVNDYAKAALQTDAAGITALRCDEAALYLIPVSAGDLLGTLLGGNF